MNKIITGTIVGISIITGYKIYGLYHKYNSILQSLHVTKSNSIELHENYAIIPYTYNNTEYSVRIPYNRSKVCHMDAFIVWGDTGNGSVNITQQPGIPYLLSADELSYKTITAHNVDEDKYYQYDDQPLYL